jgi:hypothetical protein
VHGVFENVDWFTKLTEMQSPSLAPDQLMFGFLIALLTEHQWFLPLQPWSVPEVQKSVPLIDQ